MSSSSFKLAVQDQDVSAAIEGFLVKVLDQESVHGLLAPQHLPMNKLVMPTLVTSPKKLAGADPLAPAFALNSAKQLSRLTAPPTDRTVAAVLRPCEIRAFRERIKFNQGDGERAILISLDCLGAMPNNDYLGYSGEDKKEATRRFFKTVVAGAKEEIDALPLATACRACVQPVSAEADIQIGVWGVADESVLVTAQTDKGRDLLKKLDLTECPQPPERKSVIERVVRERKQYRDKMFASTRSATDTPAKLSEYLAACVNCYNCRAACPVCYCRECVFLTEVFNHTSFQYFNWAERKGALKMPTDTLFFHLTRMAHISLSCVGCGQCSNACPNNIPVTELFLSVAHRTQREFGYSPGRDLAEAPPLTIFQDREYEEIVEE